MSKPCGFNPRPAAVRRPHLFRTESVFLKRALLLSPASAAFVVWTMLCFGVALTGALVLRKPIRAAVRGLGPEWRTLLPLAASTSVMQLTTSATSAVV